MLETLMLAAGPISVSCADIGNCPGKTPTVSAGLANIMSAGIGIIGGLAVIFVIASGLQMILSNGNAKRYQIAKQSLGYSILGVVLAITAWAIVQFVTTAFSNS